jgi:transcriptional regulator with XRE-family HTH domain
LTVELKEQGVSGYETARRIGVSSRTVRRYLEGAKDDPDQGSLF